MAPRKKRDAKPSVQDAAKQMLAGIEEAQTDTELTGLSADDKLVMVQMAASGSTQQQIADFVGCHQSTVSRFLAECRDTTPDAREYLKTQLHKMARSVVEDGEPDLHFKVLERFKAIPAEEKSPESGVVIVFGSVERPLVPPQIPAVIDVTPIAAAALPGGSPDAA